MTYVTSQPKSKANPSSKFRVVSLKQWWAYNYGTRKATPKALSEHDTFEQAAKACEKLNRPLE